MSATGTAVAIAFAAWIDGLDIPLIRQLDAGFFEFGQEVLATTGTPPTSRNERLALLASPMTDEEVATSELLMT